MTPTSPQPTEKCQIIITHYINPSLFWFKNQSSDTMQFLSHEMELQAFAKLTATKLIFSGGYQPARGEIVLVLSLRWDKWVRCKVEEIIEFSGVPEYTVWLIDYGHPLRTQARYILPLHKNLAQVKIPLIYKAGLANILPAAKVFNLETSETELIKTENWSEYAVTTIEQILTENDIVSFSAEFKIENHFFGNVEVFMYCGKLIDLRNVILSLSYGRLTNNLQAFSQDLEKGRTTKFDRFESQVRLSSFSVQKNQISHSLEVKISNKLADVPTTDSFPENKYSQKVKEWNDRNIRDLVENSSIIDCPPVPHKASRSRSAIHYTPGDDVEPNIMACAGSKEHRKMLEKNKNDVVKNNTTSDFNASFDNRDEIDNFRAKPQMPEPPMIPAGFRLDQLHTVLRPNRPDNQKRNTPTSKQFDLPANRSRETQASNANTSSSSGEFDEVNWNQSQKSTHRSSMEMPKFEHIRDSTSGPSSTSDDLEQRSSCSSKMRRRSALSMARRNAKAFK